MSKTFSIDDRTIGSGHPVYIVAEMSANHNRDYDQAVRIIHAAREAGADAVKLQAVKLQTYTPDTMTIDSDKDVFRVRQKLWEGRSLYDLYREAYTPWEWQPKLKKIADEIGITLFSTPFDATAVDFLEDMGVPAYKVASFENVDLPLLRKIASTGKPVIMSTGMATLAELDEAVRTLHEAGCRQLALLKCTSAYPAPPEDMNLRTIPHLAQAFGVAAGLSDHTLDNAVAIAAVAMGARIVEKHFTLSRSLPGPDSAFSLEPQELKSLVDNVRTVEKALGQVHYGVSDREAASRLFRRSLFVVADMKAGDPFTPENIRSIRPGQGLSTRYYEEIIGRRAVKNIARGTPLAWDLVGG